MTIIEILLYYFIALMGIVAGIGLSELFGIDPQNGWVHLLLSVLTVFITAFVIVFVYSIILWRIQFKEWWFKMPVDFLKHLFGVKSLLILFTAL
jgi:phage shock protein PspC (stress-responsive transcriptional regulator)